MITFVATLKGNSIYQINVDIEGKKINSLDAMKIGERIREIEYDPFLNVYYFILEESPSIGILQLNNS